MTEGTFDTEGVFDEDYLHFYAHAVDARADTEVELIWRLLELRPGMEVLDLACGHGRIANRLAERGVRVTGMDATSLFLDRAGRDAAIRQVAVSYVEGDMRSLPWTARFDRVINWFTAFGYFDDTDNQRVLTEVARALTPGGQLLIEMNNRDWIIRNFQPEGVMQRDDDLMIDRRRFEPLTGRMVTERTVIRQGHIRRTRFFIRMFTFTELRDWLHRAGFKTVHGHGEDGNVLEPHHRRMIVIAGR